MTTKFRVLRQHLGDRMYMPGDTREAVASEVAHLVEKGVLEPDRAKTDPKPANKAEKPAMNKAAPV